MKFDVGDKVYVCEDAPIVGKDSVFKELISEVLVATAEGVVVLGLYDRTLTIDEGFCVHVVAPLSRVRVFNDDLKRFLKVAKAKLHGKNNSDVYVLFEGDEFPYVLELDDE